MRRLWTLIALLFCATVFAGAASAADTEYPELNQLASHFALFDAHVRCPTPQDWLDDPLGSISWGYTWLGEDWTRVDPSLCDAAEALAQGHGDDFPDWKVALGVLTITHESYHIKNWKWNDDEGRVECAAIRHFPEALHELHADRLLARYAGWAIAQHFFITRLNAAYNFKRCPKIPYWPWP